MFKILQMLRDLNVQRVINHSVGEDADGNFLVVRIPISDDELKFYRDMQEMFAPVEDE